MHIRLLNGAYRGLFYDGVDTMDTEDLVMPCPRFTRLIVSRVFSQLDEGLQEKRKLELQEKRRVRRRTKDQGDDDGDDYKEVQEVCICVCVCLSGHQRMGDLALL